jgi:AcrR family transcriptional regulator
MTKLDVPAESAERPLRADARRNREKVLAAARDAFGEHGREAQIDDVARRAGVGVGTVYRHFPTKEALLAALLEQTFADIAERARPGLDADDAWGAFTAILWDAGESLAADRALSEAMAADLGDQPCPGQIDLAVIGGELMERAKAAGALRADAVIDDIPMLLCGVGSATSGKASRPDAWRRHLAIVIDGLRARPDASPLPD